MTTATVISIADVPLNQGHHHELARAKLRALPVRNAARVAAFNAWATGIIAALSAPFSLFSASGLLMTVGLVVIAGNEFRGRRRLVEFEPSAASLLGWNQLGLLAMIVVYCVWALDSGLSSENPFAAALAANPELLESANLPDCTNELYRLCLMGFYGTVIGLSVVFQGLNALYYFTRRKYVERYIAETPAWIRELRRATFA